MRDFHTDLGVGDILQRARTRAGLSLDQVAAETRIRFTYLQAIEESRFEKLPGRVYAVGFVKTYAEFLGLDGEKIIQLLKRQSGEKVELKPLASTLPVEEDHSLPEVKTYFIILIMIVAGLTLYSLAFKTNAGKQSIPSVPKDLKEQVTLLSRPQPPPPLLKNKPEVVASGEAAEAGAFQEAPKTADRPHPVVLKAIDNVWLEIRTKEQKVILSRVLSKGEEYWVPEDQNGLVMTLGNAGGLQITLDGSELPVLGRKGQVIRSLSLDPAYLKQFLKKSAR